jgi:integrase
MGGLRAFVERADPEKGHYWRITTRGRNPKKAAPSFWDNGDPSEAPRRLAAALSKRETADETKDARTVGDAIDRFVAHSFAAYQAGAKSKSVYYNRKQQAQVIERAWPEFMAIRLWSLREADLELLSFKVLASKAPSTGQPYAPATVDLVVRLPAAAMRWLRAREGGDRIPKPPFFDSEHLRVQTRDKYTPTEEECARLAAALFGWDRIMTILLWQSGARIGEIRDLTWDRVNYDQGRIYLAKTKNHKPRPVRVPAWVVDELREHRRAVLSDTSGRYTSKTHVLGVRGNGGMSRYRNRLYATQATLGLPKFTPHGFRRHMVDDLQRSGVPVKVAAELMGHSVRVMLDLYQQVAEADRVDAMEALWARRDRPSAKTDATKGGP